MGVKKGTKRKCKKKKSKVKNFSNVIQTGIRTLKTRKALALMSTIKVARKAVNKSIGRNKNKIKTPRIIIVPEICGFLPIVPILTALSAIGSLAFGSSAIAKTINNANMGEKQLEDSKRHYKKMESIKESIIRKGYGLYPNPFRGNPKKRITKLPKKPLSNSEILNFAQKYIPHFRGVFMRDSLPKSSCREESGIINLDDSSSNGTHWVAYKKNKKSIHYLDSFGNLQPPKEIVKYLGNNINITMRENKPLIVPTEDTCPSNSYSISLLNFFFIIK